MITLTATDVHALAAAAEAAYPNEACGLLEGRAESHGIVVARVHLSENVAASSATRFEVDPRLILRLHRELRAGPTRVVGVWHSHTNGRAEPSAADLAGAFEPELIWVITPVAGGRAGAPAAFQLLEGKGFVSVPLRMS